MEFWKDIINSEIKATIDLDAFAVNYLAKIKNNIAAGNPENFAIKKAMQDLRMVLIGYGFKVHDIVHLLHFCGMAIYPKMYNGCGCHEKQQKTGSNECIQKGDYGNRY